MKKKLLIILAGAITYFVPMLISYHFYSELFAIVWVFPLGVFAALGVMAYLKVEV